MKEPSNTSPEPPAAANEHLVYGRPQHAEQRVTDNETSLLDLWIILWRGKRVIVGITTLFIALSIPYALIQTEWYRADVLLASADERSTPGLMGQLGGLISLAGVSVGGRGNAEAIAILRSRDFTAAFSARQMAKDFDLMLATSKESGIPLPLTTIVRQNWADMIDNGMGELDFFAYVELLEQQAGLKK